MSVDPLIIHPKFHQLFKETFAFTEREFAELLTFFSVRRIRKKEFYLRPRQVCAAKAYLNKGCTRNFVLDERGHERILFFAFEDWWIGDFESYYTGEPATNYVQAIEDCELLLISKDRFSALEKSNPKLKQWYTVKMARSASAHLKRIEEMKTLTPEERYVDLLEKHPQLFQRIPLQYVAAYLNMEPQSLSRMRKRLSAKT